MPPRRYMARSAVISVALSLLASTVSAKPGRVSCQFGDDHTAEILALIEAGRNPIRLSRGTCKTTGNIFLPSGTRFQGSGQSRTTLLLLPGSNTHVLRVEQADDVAVTNLTIDADKANNTAGHGIRFGNSSQVQLKNLRIVDPAGYGLGFQVGSHQGISMRNVTIERPGADGMDFKNPDNANDGIRMRGITVVDPGEGKAGIDMRGRNFQLRDITVTQVGPGEVGIRFRQTGGAWGLGGHQSTLEDFVVTGSSGIGVHVVAHENTVVSGEVHGTLVGVRITSTVSSSARDNLVADVHAYECGRAGFQTVLFGDADPVQENQIVDCTSTDSLGDGIEISGTGNVVSGCVVTGSTEIGLEVLSTAISTVISGNELQGNGIDYVDNGTDTSYEP